MNAIADSTASVRTLPVPGDSTGSLVAQRYAYELRWLRETSPSVHGMTAQDIAVSLRRYVQAHGIAGFDPWKAMHCVLLDPAVEGRLTDRKVVEFYFIGERNWLNALIVRIGSMSSEEVDNELNTYIRQHGSLADLEVALHYCVYDQTSMFFKRLLRAFARVRASGAMAG